MLQSVITIQAAPSLESLLHHLPVDHIPDGTEVLGLAVLVLQVIGMLPSINTQQWCVLANNRILVGICANLDLSSLVILYEPCPSASLDTSEGGVELCLEGGEVAIGCLNCSLRSPQLAFFAPT